MSQEQFISKLRAHGIDPGGPLVEGKWTHAACSCNPRKKGKEGKASYIYHADEPATLVWMCWDPDCPNNSGGKLSAKSEKEMTQAEREIIKARIEADRKAREEARQQMERTVREKAARLWKSGYDVSADHPYIVKKGIRPVGIKQVKEMLLVPMSATGRGEPASLQLIFPDGAKRFLTGTGAVPGSLFLILAGDNTAPLYVVEGYATGCSVREATGASVAVAFSAGKLPAVAAVLKERFQDRDMVIAGDAGNGSSKAAEAAQLIGGKVVFPIMPEGIEGTDFNDLHKAAGIAEVARQLALAAITDSAPISTPAPEPEKQPEGQGRVRVVDAFDFMAMEFPPRENILAPWLPQQGLAMLYAARGIGKTHFSLGVAYAVASGGSFLSWQAPRPRGVLFLDGEMPAAVLQERIAKIAASNEAEPAAPFRILTPDLQPSGMIDLSRSNDQAALVPYLDGADLIIVDNLSTLCRSGRENEGESWLPVQEWALLQRAAGRSVLFIHHAGKGGGQRGSSRKEDVLDTVINLRHPGDYTPDQGATFEVHFEKARGIYGEDTKAFEAQLTTTPTGLQSWTVKHLEESTLEKVVKLLQEGLSQVEVAEILGINKSNVSRARKKAQEQGLLVDVATIP